MLLCLDDGGHVEDADAIPKQIGVAPQRSANFVVIEGEGLHHVSPYTGIGGRGGQTVQANIGANVEDGRDFWRILVHSP